MTGLHEEDVGQEIIPLPCHLTKGTQENGEQAIHDALLNLFFFFLLFCICCQVMDGGAWWAAVHGVARSWTRLSDFTFNFHFHALEKEVATHSSVLAWRIPGMGEPYGLLSMGLHRVGHD